MRMQAIRACMLRVACGCLTGLALAMVAGCGPVRLVAATNIPTPLIVKIPVGVALFIPAEFSQYAHLEERWSTKWHIDLGHAQTEGITRLLQAMFERVVVVDSLNAARLDSGIRAILEPSIEEYAFVTPRDAGSPFFAVSIKYRVNVYLPDGKLADSWGFTGYGSSPSRGLSSGTPLAAATALAMRDAGAKLAVEFREQAVLRGLLSEPASADAPGTPAGSAADPAAVPAPDPEPGLSQDPGLPQDQDSTTPVSEDPLSENEDTQAGDEPGAAPATESAKDGESSEKVEAAPAAVPLQPDPPTSDRQFRPGSSAGEAQEIDSGSGPHAAGSAAG